MGLWDLHSHVLYGLDDGAATREEMFAMLDAAWKDGIRLLGATPHCVPGIEPFDHQAWESRFREAEDYCRAQKYNIRLVKGAEILYTPALSHYAQTRQLMTLGESNRVLMEFSPGIPLREMEKGLSLVEENGYQVMLAHGERYGCLLSPGVLGRLKKRHPSLLVQVNAHTLVGKPPLRIRLAVGSWLKNRLVDCIASDAHDGKHRPYLQSAARRELEKTCPKEYVMDLLGMKKSL